MAPPWKRIVCSISGVPSRVWFRSAARWTTWGTPSPWACTQTRVATVFADDVVASRRRRSTSAYGSSSRPSRTTAGSHRTEECRPKCRSMIESAQQGGVIFHEPPAGHPRDNRYRIAKHGDRQTKDPAAIPPLLWRFERPCSNDFSLRRQDADVAAR